MPLSHPQPLDGIKHHRFVCFSHRNHEPTLTNRRVDRPVDLRPRRPFVEDRCQCDSCHWTGSGVTAGRAGERAVGRPAPRAQWQCWMRVDSCTLPVFFINICPDATRTRPRRFWRDRSPESELVRGLGSGVEPFPKVFEGPVGVFGASGWRYLRSRSYIFFKIVKPLVRNKNNNMALLREPRWLW